MLLPPLTLTQLSHIERRPADRVDAACTWLEAEVSGHGRQRLCVPGHPPLCEGMVVSVWLEQPGDWHSLAGWRDWTHDRLVLAPIGHALAWAIGCVVACALYTVLALQAWQHTGHPDSGALGLAMGCAMVAGLAERRRRRQRRVQHALQHAHR